MEIFQNVRSSHRSCSVRKDVLRNFAKSTGKHLCQGLFFNKVAGLNFAKFLRTLFLQNTSGRLFLKRLERLFFRTLVDKCFSKAYLGPCQTSMMELLEMFHCRCLYMLLIKMRVAVTKCIVCTQQPNGCLPENLKITETPSEFSRRSYAGVHPYQSCSCFLTALLKHLATWCFSKILLKF